MASADELKKTINCHDLAQRLGLERPKGKGNYKSPHHDDKSPSLSIKDDGSYFQDYSSSDDDASGSCIDLYMYVTNCDFKEACKQLQEMYGLESNSPVTPRSKDKWEYIADQCLDKKERAIDYLVNKRGIPEETVEKALKYNCVGFNDWTNPQSQPGEPDYGGDAVAFIVRSLNPGRVVAIDNRYLDPDMCGGLKTKTQGEKLGYPWFMDLQRLTRAETVYIVESPINALSIESCDIPFTSAIAVRAIKAVDQIDWSFLRGKQVYLAFDNDGPNEKNISAGRDAMYRLYDTLIGYDIASMMVDHSKWEEEWNDINDILQAAGPEELERKIRMLEPWAFQGMPGNIDEYKGRPRVFLPGHDYMQYWRFRVKKDFITFVEAKDSDEDGNEKIKFCDVAGFRIASISRVRVASCNSVLSAQPDLMPTVLFSVSVQIARHKAELQRRVFRDEQLHNIDMWTKFGSVWNKKQFTRLVNIMERGADLGSRDAINFVGLGWLNNKLVVNEGKDSYFTDPEQQCPYHNLSFPSAPIWQAKKVIKAYSETFNKSAALIPLVWGLGGHLKAFFGFYPHLIMQAGKGAGKSTFCDRLESTLAMTIFGRESATSLFRLLTTISHTSHPVGIEEISAGEQKQIDQAVAALQQAYQSRVTRRGTKLTEFMLCAPVLLTGEDVPVKSLIGKVVRTDLTGKKGAMLPHDLSVFPVKEWLQYLSNCRKSSVIEIYEECCQLLLNKSLANENDEGAKRMTKNYAALLTAWRFLCDFSGIASKQYSFSRDLIEEMNLHIKTTDAEREPWVWGMEMILSEIDTNRYRHKYIWDTLIIKGVQYDCLFIRHTDIINHFRSNTHLRDFWNNYPVKTATVFKDQMRSAGVVLGDKHEKTINNTRVGRMLALDLEKLQEFGLNPSPNFGNGRELPFE